ncbi:dihydrofolate reductase family protein [Furfurilactobacillus siliginis]|uniref:Diacylglycerol kinase n=1 Tax=Furfurilactobacillus siliginis TaxID=348151 RepID=A0A0R2LBP2_9LACO|nr:dihydrofolate reductase family protein [Furfurilactobacillus siliginis]KRN96684.1 hypothetical protein IV55_GL001216 [Furfurilactobacillus siliginis]GEK29114.1 diacylglycerol kinase [Furfurilactobacillus siliginis]
MREVIAYLGSSLDGFIATSDESVDWLENTPTIGDGGFQQFYDTVDTVIMGATTYRWIKQHMPDYPYSGKENFVISHTTQPSSARVTFTDDFSTLLSELKTQPGKNIWIVGGGQLVRQLLENRLLTQLRITFAPTILGAGIPLFPNGISTHQLTLLDTEQFGQLIELRYRVDD